MTKIVKQQILASNSMAKLLKQGLPHAASFKNHPRGILHDKNHYYGTILVYLTWNMYSIKSKKALLGGWM